MTRSALSRAAPRRASPRRAWLRVPLLALLGGLASCDMAPAYHPAHLLLPDDWKGDGIMRFAAPQDAALRGDWWTAFNDPVLNRLEEQANRTNPDLQVAAETFTQARDMAAEARAGLYPQVTGQAAMSKNKGSDHRLWRGAGSTGPVYMSSEQYGGTASWEPDFWSSIRNQVRMRRQSAQERAADYALMRLSLDAELATDYMALRGLDAQDTVYRDSIRTYQLAVQITRLRQAGAIAAGLDVSRAQNQLYATQAQETDLQARRAVLEHAIAVLVNVSPSAFHIEPVAALNLPDIVIPVGVPSTLLERRPDVAGAEREMAQANRAIGVSRAAFYPHVTFNAMTGFMDNGFSLADLSNSMYSYAAQAVMPLFQGGLRRAELQRTWSQYRQAEDNYRAVVLSAFQDVEDGLTLTGRLRVEQQQQEGAVKAALRTQNMTMTLYTGGLTNYLDVVVAQIAALTARISEVQVETRRLQANVTLIRALGGGWSRSQLPDSKSIMPFAPLQYDGLRTPKSVGGIAVGTSPEQSDLTGTGLRGPGLTPPGK
ncbi:efflux transporter outer membrane subunit [Gluconacetobacter tumulisoli]|uniref:Efflux transporter outer membrane subunit n=1 Tax=Gluconacetobacter tumulisoli TaxID=1286189 RepID=A0A7W4K4E3_9PROT|nr:efflux transporter outer membrane subunit [Gluconacetobacter tumulisoli]MBB2200189.1 efflux transporter outer membrane subunit [Gluconacetobacter tumulisoli]